MVGYPEAIPQLAENRDFTHKELTLKPDSGWHLNTHSREHRSYRVPTGCGAASSTLASRRNFAASSGGVGLI